MKFGLIIVGDEILSGKRQDKHLAKVIELLAARGLAVTVVEKAPQLMPPVDPEVAQPMAAAYAAEREGYDAFVMSYLSGVMLPEIRALVDIPVANYLEAAAHMASMYGYRFGIIGNTSLPFCSDCDRLRLDSHGNIYGCLSSARGISVAGTQTNMTSALATAMQMKQNERFTGSPLVMRDIGG